MDKCILRVLAASTFVICSWMVLPRSMADDKPRSAAPKVYSSPEAVFDAYRDARGKRDWHGIFRCVTSEFRDDEVFEAFFACAMDPSNPRIVAVLKKHRVDLNTIQARYNERFKEEHGVDLAKLKTDRKKAAAESVESRRKQQAMPTPGKSGSTPGPIPSRNELPPLPPTDDALLRKVVSAAIADKAGFCESVDSVIGGGQPPSPIGKLEQITVERDTAVGRARTTIDHLESEPGRGLQRTGQVIEMTFRFRKFKDAWLIESGG